MPSAENGFLKGEEEKDNTRSELLSIRSSRRKGDLMAGAGAHEPEHCFYCTFPATQSQ